MRVWERERERELELAHFAADNLVAPKSFYPSAVPVNHHQLRHLVSVTRGHHAFYVNDHDIYVLDLQSRQRCLLATVPFGARCLAADHGWPEPVVLISNNDHTVNIYSLVQRKVLSTLSHVEPMNYAAISPDSTVLAAVGDSDRVYFYARRKLAGARHRAFPEFAWTLLAAPTVPTGPGVYDDHAFAVAFSPSGRLCAASSQGGAITVFDMDVLLSRPHAPQHAILCTFRSSRPTLWGCVRSMAFSPSPWDLLAWAEDHGRIGVADVRQSFIRRQTVCLDKSKADFMPVHDSTPPGLKGLSIKEKLKEQHLARLRSVREAGPTLNRAGSLLSTATGRAQLDQDDQAAMRRRQDLRHGFLTYHQGLGLDARERSVLAALETPMDEVEPGSQPYSLHYASSPHLRPSQAAADVDFAAVSNDAEALLRSSYNHSVPPVQPWDMIQAALESARQADASHSAPPTDQPVSLAQIDTAIEAERTLADQLERQFSDERQLSDLLRRQLETQEQLVQSQPRGDIEAEGNAGNAASTLQQHEAHRRERQAWLENLERQVRRAESIVAVAAAEIRTLQAALQRNDLIGIVAGPERNDTTTRQMINVLRQQARRQVLAQSDGPSAATPSSAASPPSSSTSVPRPRPRSDREAHLMFIQSAGLRDADSNGNWVGSGQLFMIYNQGRAAHAGPHAAAATTRHSRPGDPADVAREVEVGTTGISWSADGRRLFCGTEQGIFEYTVNIQDRMQFPSLELR
ncbi:hypothetical protein DV737_g5753, partial [Chaetothyriales sp. CBS 132003]